MVQNTDIKQTPRQGEIDKNRRRSSDINAGQETYQEPREERCEPPTRARVRNLCRNNTRMPAKEPCEKASAKIWRSRLKLTTLQCCQITEGRMFARISAPWDQRPRLGMRGERQQNERTNEHNEARQATNALQDIAKLEKHVQKKTPSTGGEAD